MALSDVIESCSDKWRANGLMLAPAVTEAEVRQVWLGFNKKVSSDVLQFYTTLGGFNAYTFDDEFFWSLWPWDCVRQRNSESPREGVMFCDHSIEIVIWELRYENPKISSVWSSNGRQSAPTLESFLQRYLEDPWQLM